MKKNIAQYFLAVSIFTSTFVWANNLQEITINSFSLQECLSEKDIPFELLKAKCNQKFLEDILLTAQNIKSIQNNPRLCEYANSFLDKLDIEYNFLMQFQDTNPTKEGLSELDIFLAKKEISEATDILFSQCK